MSPKVLVEPGKVDMVIDSIGCRTDLVKEGLQGGIFPTIPGNFKLTKNNRYFIDDVMAGDAV